MVPHFEQSFCRDDYSSLTSDIFLVILLNVQPLILCLSNAMYGCPIKLRDNMVIDGFLSDHFLKFIIISICSGPPNLVCNETHFDLVTRVTFQATSHLEYCDLILVNSQ